jgi:hypothetical protein
MPDGARVFLPELVGNDGIHRVSDLAVADLILRLTGPDGMSDAFLADDIVLGFDPYAVAAYAAGPQQVHIPLTRLQDVVTPRCFSTATATSRPQCAAFRAFQAKFATWAP